MDLSFLIPSKVRRAVLAWWVDNPDAVVGIRELARELKLSPQQVYRELLNLEGWGFLFSSRRGNQRAFRANPRFPFASAIHDLFVRFRVEESRRYDIVQTYDLEAAAEKLRKIPIPPELVSGLTGL